MEFCSLIFGCTDSLSCTLQSSSLGLGDAVLSAKVAVASLERVRTMEQFLSVFNSAECKCLEYDFEQPCLPRKRFIPRRIDEGCLPHTFDTPKDYYRQVYYSCLDTIIGTVNERFDQPCLKIYTSIEQTLLRAVSGENYDASLNDVIVHFGDDINATSTRQLQNLSDVISDKQRSSCTSVSCLTRHLVGLGSIMNTLFSQVIILIKLFLIMPVTSASAERSFSSLRRLKTYLRSTMGQGRLNHVTVLNTHTDILDELDLQIVAEEFVTARENRRITFGHFADSL